MEHDDDMRWLIALISDTGMRLAEAANLHIDDIRLDELKKDFIDQYPLSYLPIPFTGFSDCGLKVLHQIVVQSHRRG